MSLKALARRAAKLTTLLSRSGFRRGLRQGVAAAVEHLGAIRSVDIGTLIDVGANKGQFSLAVRAVHPNAAIFAFEPLPGPADRYEILFPADSRTRLCRAAVGDEPGTATIHISGREDSSSLLPITQKQNALFPGTAEVATASVPVVRLDDVLPTEALAEPIFVKLDVQGFELTALRGGLELLRRATYVYVEVSFFELYIHQPLAHEIVEWLKSENYILVGVYNIVSEPKGRAIQADMMFGRKIDSATPQ